MGEVGQLLPWEGNREEIHVPKLHKHARPAVLSENAKHAALSL